MKYPTLSTKALSLAYEVHKNQKDKAGVDYILHPLSVAMILANGGYSDIFITTALLHDVVEDSDYSIADLRTMGFPEEVLEALRLLTHDKSEPYFDYIERLKQNELARTVKIADLTHNLDQSRCPNPTKADFERWEKYKKALEMLK
ncbi:MAG: HD domain-containing protein [Bacteroidales bacterium]|nr:HD domain-containing protein [Bacteroidales bacterium]